VPGTPDGAAVSGTAREVTYLYRWKPKVWGTLRGPNLKGREPRTPVHGKVAASNPRCPGQRRDTLCTGVPPWNAEGRSAGEIRKSARSPQVDIMPLFGSNLRRKSLILRAATVIPGSGSFQPQDIVVAPHPQATGNRYTWGDLPTT
jgi:hypothetical protein